MTVSAKPAPARTTAVMQGILCMTVSSLVIAVQDGLVKWVSGYPIGEIIFLRAAFMFAPIAFIVWRSGGVSSLKTRMAWLQTWRGLLLIVGMFFYISSLRYLPLADALTLNFCSPLFVTALAMPFLGERVGWRRWSAVVVGFIGIAVMLRPAEAVLNIGVVFAVLSAFITGVRDIYTRRMAATEHPAAFLFYTNVVVVAGSLASLPAGWEPMRAFDVWLLAIMALLVVIGEYLNIQAIRLAEVAITMPFRYTAVPWAVLIGYVVWGDVPDRYMIAGGALVVGSGLYILQRETKLARMRARRDG